MAINVEKIRLSIKGIQAALIGRFKTKSRMGFHLGAYKYIFVQIFAFLLFVMFTFWTVSHMRVTGSMYEPIAEYQDLRAHIFPTALYPVEALVSFNQAYIASVAHDEQKLNKHLEEARIAEKAFDDELKFWNVHIKTPHLKENLAAVSKSGKSFFSSANQRYIPALKENTETAVVPFAELTATHAKNKAAISHFVVALENEHQQLLDQQSKSLWILFIGLGLFALVIVLMMAELGRRQVSVVYSGVERLEVESELNQQAVLKLLDEMGDLADGDLTVKAEVTESITGAIADSINYTIESLRSLVVEINRATAQVNQATAQAQNTSESLLLAAEEQSSQIAEAGQAVSLMTNSMSQVSMSASEASSVAQRSLQAAMLGTQAVQNTISGMNEIRSQIQETSKRIKRLGESSQEISEIVELISDITEQTNILALNAAIQAASAGEAGRGFTVVAEEVQRLAERSSEATKQISAIVKTIQTDTSSAVVAMEKSTEGVVDGAKLSDAAGQALNEIETVTKSLAKLIASISDATDKQTISAATVTRNMQLIQNITSQTTTGTKLTAESVGQLSGLAEELRESVAGFKLS